jgi:hypothetical protein
MIRTGPKCRGGTQDSFGALPLVSCIRPSNRRVVGSLQAPLSVTLERGASCRTVGGIESAHLQGYILLNEISTDDQLPQVLARPYSSCATESRKNRRYGRRRIYR